MATDLVVADQDDNAARAAVESTRNTSLDSASVAKGFSEEMSMTEFAGWLSTMKGTSWQRASRQAAFMLCCDVIAQDVAKASLQLREILPNGTSRIVLPDQHPIATFLADEPNPRHTWYEFNEMQVYWHCFTKNAYTGVIRNMVGDPEKLIPIPKDRVTERIAGSALFYDVVARYEHEQSLLGSSSRTFPERDMIHTRSRMLDGLEGYSTLEAGQDIIETADAIAEFRASLFGQEGQVRGVFSRADTTTVLPEEAFTRLRQQYKFLMNNFRRATEPIVLEGGLTFTAISSKPNEIELAKAFEQQVTETCRMLRVPPYKVFQMEGMKYENLETSEKMYVNDTLVPVCEPFEQRFKKGLLDKKDRAKFFFQFNRDEMTLRDTKLETERAYRSLTNGAIDFDEFRAVFGYNPMPNGQGKMRLIPVNMNLIDENGNVVVGGAAAQQRATGDDAPAPADPKKALHIVGGTER